MEIRTRTEASQRVLQAAVKSDIEYLEQTPENVLKDARCTSGCSALHWAAGSNQVNVVKHLIVERSFDADTLATRKARGRTPLHYACRNGCLEAAKLLVALGADVDARAKHGVSPFQLAVWQNQISICTWLVEEHGVDPAQVNDFDCGAIHWIGICPAHRADAADSKKKNGSGLIQLAKWLAGQPGVDFRQRQRQGHTILHKAAWGGHIALIRYARDAHNMLDKFQDYAGNYAADLADMANTARHAEVARFLREECSAARAKSCAILGVSVGASPLDIRKAYLFKARQLHPDRISGNLSTSALTDQSDETDFDLLRKAYEHLTLENGKGSQSNPAHSLNLMIELSKTEIAEMRETEAEAREGNVCFKARLIAVLLEYGGKGLDLSNVKKKWRQVWPDTPFPNEHESYIEDRDRRKRKGVLVDFIDRNAGDVVDIVVDGKGSIRIIPKTFTQEHVALGYAAESKDMNL